MELPKSGREFWVEGSRFILRLPILRMSYLRNHPTYISPLSVDMNITDRCNFRCKHCRGVTEDYKPKAEINFDAMKNVLDDMEEMNIPYLTLGGGEPLLRFDFVLEIIEYAKKHGIKVGIVTNGSLLNEGELIKLSKASLHRIAFSLDGSNKETHDEARMKGSFNQIMSNLTLCQNLKKDFRVHINTVVMRQNLSQLTEIAKIAQEFNATAFYQPIGIPQVYPLQGGDLSPTSGIEPFVIKGEELGKLELEIKKLINFKRRYGVIGNLIWQLSNIVNYYKGLEAGKSLVKFKCYAGFNTIHLESDGEFSSCIFMPSVGNIQNISLKKAWRSEEYDKQRKLIRQCTRPCELNCYYPTSLPGLVYEFLYLPVRRLTGLGVRRTKNEARQECLSDNRV